MTERQPESPQADEARSDASPPAEPRAPYAPPKLVHLGPWQAFTLQQSVPISP
jgi:hypothetical protein